MSEFEVIARILLFDWARRELAKAFDTHINVAIAPLGAFGGEDPYKHGPELAEVARAEAAWAAALVRASNRARLQ